MSSSLVLDNRKILLGVTGGIALYKACELIRLLKKEGAFIRVILSTGAEEFVKPLLFSALSGERVFTNRDFFASTGFFPHIELANWAEVNIILPATASFLSKLRTGQASELLLATLLASRAPTYLFPSMNCKMYEHPATKENIQKLRDFGYFIYEPSEGELACGEIGIGRLPEPIEILQLIIAHFTPKDLKNKKILITGGPTREYLDDVRFLTNDSSGLTAYLLTQEAYFRGGEVILLWGHREFPYLLPKLHYFSEIPYPKIFFTLTTEEMFAKAKEFFKEVDIAIFAGAPCDFKPKSSIKGKIKKTASLTIELELTPDIAKSLAQEKNKQITIGFALEEDSHLREYAWQKKREKNFDILVANPLRTLGAEGADYLILLKDQEKAFSNLSKRELSKLLFDSILSLL